MTILKIDETDVDNLVECWKETIQRSAYVEPYNEAKEALVFSFDNEMKPFLNYTKGYHSDLKQRPYFGTTPRILREIAALVSPYREMGGRVFMDRQYAYFVDGSLKRTNICELMWPNGRDAINAIHGYWKASLPRIEITLARSFQVGR
jgi:hypothetical protein